MKYFYQDHEITEDEAFDNGILKDGVRMVSSVMLRDSAGNMLVDALGQPISGGHHGYVFADADAQRRLEDRAYQKAELSSRWKGGLTAGDHVTIGDQRLEVTGRNPENGKLVLSDTAELDADDEKKQAYDSYERDLTDAWKTRPTNDAEPGDACHTSDGRRGQWWRGKDGRLVCKAAEREPSDMEWKLSGPLSDSRRVEVQKARDTAYQQSVEQLQNNWRK